MVACDIISTELNHDLNPPITQKLHKGPEFLKATRKLTPCDDMNGTGATQKSEKFSEWFKDDYNFFSSIVYCKLNESGPEIDISPNMLFEAEAVSNAGGGPSPMYNTSDGTFTGRWGANTVGGKMPLIVRRFNQVGNGGSNFEDKNILKIFDNCSKQDNELNAFFIVDTGDKFLKVLSQGSMNIDREAGFNEPEYHFHQIHSGTTLGDSASKTKPHAPIYDKQYNNKSDALPTLYSWMFLKNIKVGRRDSQISSDDFKTAYEIDIKYLPYPPYTMQNWKYHNNGSYDYNTTDPHKDNNKPNVIAWLNNKAIKQVKSGVISEDLKNNISLNLQKKRSGDALQYLFAKNLADMIGDANNIQLVKPSALGTPHPRWLSKDRDINFYKKNTFFLTGDWPAAAAALNHGVNTIMFYKSTDKTKTCFLSFAFELEPEPEPEPPPSTNTSNGDDAIAKEKKTKKRKKKTKKRKKKRKKTKNKSKQNKY